MVDLKKYCENVACPQKILDKCKKEIEELKTSICDNPIYLDLKIIDDLEKMLIKKYGFCETSILAGAQLEIMNFVSFLEAWRNQQL